MAIRIEDSETSNNNIIFDDDARIKNIKLSKMDKNEESGIIHNETSAKVKKHMFDKSWKTTRNLIWGTFVFTLCVVAIHIIENPYFVVNEWVAVAAIGALIGQSYPLLNVLKYMTS